MDITIEALTTVAGLVAAVIVAMTVLKPILFGPNGGPAQDRWAPALAIVVGIVLALGANIALGTFGRAEIAQALLNGFIAGAASVGIYTTGKNALRST